MTRRLAGVRQGARLEVTGPVQVVNVRVTDDDGSESSVPQYIATARDANGVERTVLIDDENGAPPRAVTSSVAVVEGVDRFGEVIVGLQNVVPTVTMTMASPLGKKKLMVFRVEYEGTNSCGTQEAPAPCNPVCSFDEIYNTVIGGPNSASKFYQMISKNAFELTADKSTWMTVKVPVGTPVFHVGSKIKELVGEKPGDYFAYYFPDNYRRDQFSGTASGMGSENGQFSWYRSCDFQVFAHEFAHNINLGHAGSYDASSRFQEYRDASSVMSAALGGNGGWRGLSASQMAQMGWLKEEDILHIRKDGDYRILSLTGGTGVRAAKIYQPGFEPLWLEWRQNQRFDKDLEDAQRYVDRVFATNPKGKLVGALLLKTDVKEPRRAAKSALLAIIDPGETSPNSRSGVIIKADENDPGRFTVSGVREQEIPTPTRPNPPSQRPRDDPSSPSSGGRTLCRDGKGGLQLYRDAAATTKSRKISRKDVMREVSRGAQTTRVHVCKSGEMLYVKNSDVKACNKPCSR